MIEDLLCPTCGGVGVLPHGSFLRKARTDAGLTLSQVAKESGYSLPYISSLECGTRRLTPRKSRIILDAIGRLSGGD